MAPGPSVRAVILDDDRLILFRRTVPGRPLYWSAPGGHVEPGDATLEDTLRREMLEELGATVGGVTPLVTLSYPSGDGVKVQHVYGCRLLTMDLALRCGPEFRDPASGVYEVVRLPLAPEEIAGINLVPGELRDYLARTITDLPALIP
ncbi:8-oxo-dGTP pyrophosphatase MutT (NUDIX family) [Thermocatellispora tengchongensis]|uniref:8-oxo-dGTP pyrophosphatase MutT (NUDIX family) n=2 Tax=Thermocatellispora tengchongensis TaxID=1073253 RepID=A0A840NYX7_9ACTN|nr:NUDIX hydrolase [Thermocatellispora tengchongensis]MBB5131969.1 8-oxo-dGTP pyrophosphatase MutT (NUDIX family) [Thermocatellispora tengchongensis]